MLLCALALAASPATAAAQQDSGPLTMMFGRPPLPTGEEWTVLHLQGSAGGEWDDGLFINRHFDGESGLTRDERMGGFAAGTTAALSFGRHTAMSDVQFTGQGVFRQYFAEPDALSTHSQTANFRYAVSPTTRLRFDTSATYNRQPYFQLLPMGLASEPDWIAPVSATPFVSVLEQNQEITGEAGFEYSLSKRSTMAGSFSRTHWEYEAAPNADFDVRRGQGWFRHRLSRDLSMHVGYGRDEYHTPLEHFFNDRLDVGVDLRRELTLAHRLTFSFTTQPSIVRERDKGRFFRLNGNVILTKWFQRTWRATLAAQRSTEFIPGFLEPVSTDTAQAAVGGRFTDKIEWFVRGGGGQGAYSIDGSGPRFLTAVASSRLSVRVTRHVDAHVQYSFMHYDTPGAAQAIDGIARMSRQTVTVGMNFWIPLYLQVKAPSDTQ